MNRRTFLQGAACCGIIGRKTSTRTEAAQVPLPSLAMSTPVEPLARLDRADTSPLPTAISTGFKDLDQLTGGLRERSLVVIASRPSMGRTTLALNIAEHIALVRRRPVAVFCGEASAALTFRQLVASHAGVDRYTVVR
jgi:replicative DNA helicase